MSASWKVAAVVFGLLLVVFGLCMGLVVVPTANKARQIAGGYNSPAAAQAALKANPNDAFAHITLANDAKRRGEQVAALKELQEAARLDPANGYNQMELAFQLLALHRRDEAKVVLQTLAQTNHEEAVHAAQLLKKLK